MGGSDNRFPAERDFPFWNERRIQHEFPCSSNLSKIADYFIGISKVGFKHIHSFSLHRQYILQRPPERLTKYQSAVSDPTVSVRNTGACLPFYVGRINVANPIR